jgi:hypothetical protein
MEVFCFSSCGGQVSAISSQVSAISGRCHVTAERSSLRILKFMVFSLLLYSPDLELIASDLSIYLVPAAFPPLSYIN